MDKMKLTLSDKNLKLYAKDCGLSLGISQKGFTNNRYKYRLLGSENPRRTKMYGFNQNEVFLLINSYLRGRK